MKYPKGLPASVRSRIAEARKTTRSSLSAAKKTKKNAEKKCDRTRRAYELISSNGYYYCSSLERLARLLKRVGHARSIADGQRLARGARKIHDAKCGVIVAQRDYDQAHGMAFILDVWCGIEAQKCSAAYSGYSHKTVEFKPGKPGVTHETQAIYGREWRKPYPEYTVHQIDLQGDLRISVPRVVDGIVTLTAKPTGRLVQDSEHGECVIHKACWAFGGKGARRWGTTEGFIAQCASFYAHGKTQQEAVESCLSKVNADAWQKEKNERAAHWRREEKKRRKKMGEKIRETGVFSVWQFRDLTKACAGGVESWMEQFSVQGESHPLKILDHDPENPYIRSFASAVGYEFPKGGK